MSRQNLIKFQELNRHILSFYENLNISPNYSKVVREMLDEKVIDERDIELAEFELESLKKYACELKNWKVI